MVSEWPKVKNYILRKSTKDKKFKKFKKQLRSLRSSGAILNIYFYKTTQILSVRDSELWVTLWLFLGKLTRICSYIRKPKAKPKLYVGENLKMRFSAAFQQESWKIHPFNYRRFEQKQFWISWPQLGNYSSVHYGWFEDRFPLFFPLLCLLPPYTIGLQVSQWLLFPWSEYVQAMVYMCGLYPVKISKALIQKLDMPERAFFLGSMTFWSGLNFPSLMYKYRSVHIHIFLQLLSVLQVSPLHLCKSWMSNKKL